MPKDNLILFDVDTANGEASLAPSTKKMLEQMREANPILAADLMRDISYLAEQERQKALDVFRSRNKQVKANG